MPDHRGPAKPPEADDSTGGVAPGKGSTGGASAGYGGLGVGRRPATLRADSSAPVIETDGVGLR